MVGRMAKLTAQVFETEPIVLSLPYQAGITPRDKQGNRLSFLIAGAEQSTALKGIREHLRERQFFWVHSDPAANARLNAYRRSAPFLSGAQPSEWFKLGPARVQTEGIGRLPTDDFPFLYLRDPVIPGLNLRGM